MKIKLFVLSIILMTGISSAWADSMKMGTGSEGKTYNKMGQDIVAFCSASVSRPMEVIPQSGGSVGGIMGGINKEYHMFMSQLDVAKYYSEKLMPNKFNKQRFRVVTCLHREAGHLLIPKGWSPKNSGFAGFLDKFGFGNNNQGISIDLLKGQVVGAWGGSLVSTKALSAYQSLGIQAVEIKPGEKVSHPIMVVEGQPSSTVQDYLNAGYQLVPIDAESLKSRAPFYDSVQVSYVVNGKVNSVPTFGVRACLFGKASREESRNKPMSELATCIRNNLVDLADDTDTNPNWESVFEFEDGDNQINWSYFPILEK